MFRQRRTGGVSSSCQPQERGVWDPVLHVDFQYFPIIAVAVLLAACAPGETKEAADEFQTAIVERGTLVSSVEATGTIEPIKVIDIKSQASGEIIELGVELGDHVKKGDLLVRIDPRDVRNAYEQARADLAVAQARFGVGETRLARAHALRDSLMVSDEALETAIMNHADARAALVKAETNLELALDRLNDVTVRAPLAGTVVEKNVEEGQIVTSTREVTGGTVLMRMADLNQVQVRTLVDETDIGKLESGLPAEIRVEAYPERTFGGSLLKIEPQAVVQQNVTMFAVLTQITNIDNMLRPGMNADVEIVIGRREEVLTLSNGAVKTPREARELVEALGLDPKLLEARAPEPQRSTSATELASNGGVDEARADPDDPQALLQRLQTMSRDERRRYFQSLPVAERRRLFQAMQRNREQQGHSQRDPSQPRAAFVFKRSAEGGLTLEPITIGLSSWEQTEIIAGLDEGDEVISVPLALIQQRELLERVRSRSGVPGVSR